MLILLDENLLSKKLKKPFIDAGHSVQNVEDMGWRGVKDKELLALADRHCFDVFVTSDKNLPYQQNFRLITLRVLVLDTLSTRPDYLIPLIIQVSGLLESLTPSSVTFINNEGEVQPLDISDNECRDVALLRLYKGFRLRIFNFWRCLFNFSGGK